MLTLLACAEYEQKCTYVHWGKAHEGMFRSATGTGELQETVLSGKRSQLTVTVAHMLLWLLVVLHPNTLLCSHSLWKGRVRCTNQPASVSLLAESYGGLHWHMQH